MKTLFDQYIDKLKEAWYSQIEWSPGTQALEHYRRGNIQSDIRSGRKHRTFPQRPDQPPVDWTR